MQVKIKQEPKVFNPVTLEITFETEEELKMINDMLSRNVSIPEIIYEDEQSKQASLQVLMVKIRDKLFQVR